MESDEGWGPVEGRRVRVHLERMISQTLPGTSIALSMEGIARTDSIFPREAVVEIARYERGQRGICLVYLHDAALLENWDNAARRCQQPLFAWNTDFSEVHLLGPQAPIGLRGMLNYVLSVERARASEAAKKLQVSIQNASNKLRDLWEAGYILREEQCARSGGREFTYFKIIGKTNMYSTPQRQ